MKLSAYAKHLGISYQTAWRMWQRGELPAHQLPSGTVIVDVPPTPQVVRPQKVAVYARVSSAEDRKNLEGQAERVSAFCAAKGWQVAKVMAQFPPTWQRYFAQPAVPIPIAEPPRAVQFISWLERLLADPSSPIHPPMGSAPTRRPDDKNGAGSAVPPVPPRPPVDRRRRPIPPKQPRHSLELAWLTCQMPKWMREQAAENLHLERNHLLAMRGARLGQLCADLEERGLDALEIRRCELTWLWN